MPQSGRWSVTSCNCFFSDALAETAPLIALWYGLAANQALAGSTLQGPRQITRCRQGGYGVADRQYGQQLSLHRDRLSRYRPANAYVKPFDISIRSMADCVGVAASALARIVAERSLVSPEMALRLSKVLGRSSESWLAMQNHYDLWQARKSANLSNVRKTRFDATA